MTATEKFSSKVLETKKDNPDGLSSFLSSYNIDEKEFGEYPEVAILFGIQQHGDAFLNDFLSLDSFSGFDLDKTADNTALVARLVSKGNDVRNTFKKQGGDKTLAAINAKEIADQQKNADLADAENTKKTVITFIVVIGVLLIVVVGLSFLKKKKN
jgi:hypothetical protein